VKLHGDRKILMDQPWQGSIAAFWSRCVEPERCSVPLRASEERAGLANELAEPEVGEVRRAVGAAARVAEEARKLLGCRLGGRGEADGHAVCRRRIEG